MSASSGRCKDCEPASWGQTSKDERQAHCGQNRGHTIIEHFRTVVAHQLGGKAKAMVVTGSRLQAVKYKLSFDGYIQRKGYPDIRCLVAFSGEVTDDVAPSVKYTEVGMNGGVKEAELPERFASDAYQVLLVANKYQTGFDQPLLCAMYVDKRLAGIQAVQTLSRLNPNGAGQGVDLRPRLRE